MTYIELDALRRKCERAVKEQEPFVYMCQALEAEKLLDLKADLEAVKRVMELIEINSSEKVKNLLTNPA